MNTLTILETVALKNLSDRTVWRALLDHHEEALELPHAVALRAVAAIRRNAKLAAELVRATEAISDNGAHAESIRDAIRACCQWSHAHRATIIVRTGRFRPRLYAPINKYGDPVARGSTITVGARFVLKLARLRREVFALESELHSNIAGPLFNI